MVMTSCHSLVFVFMDALMGKGNQVCLHGIVFDLHVCIRFSRRLMRLKVGKSNHDPAVILYYYLQCVSECGGKSEHAPLHVLSVYSILLYINFISGMLHILL